MFCFYYLILFIIKNFLGLEVLVELALFCFFIYITMPWTYVCTCMLHLVARVAFSLHVEAPVTLHFVTMKGHWHQEVVLTYPDSLSRCLYLIGVKPWALCCQNLCSLYCLSNKACFYMFQTIANYITKSKMNRFKVTSSNH